MSTPTVVFVTRLEEFTDEISPNNSPVRLCLFERRGGTGMIPTKQLILTLQGWNSFGELLYLTEVHTVDWINGEPASPRDKSIAAAMDCLHDCVRQHLLDHDYQVRPGYYAHQDFKPILGQFECGSWQRNEDGTYTLVPLDQEETQ